MGLEGYLEDLGIADILQIVSLSKKSGELTLANQAEQGSITFLAGQVVGATSSRFPEPLGQLLVAKGVANQPQVNAALLSQKQRYRPLGVILAVEQGVAHAAVEAVVGQQIESIVGSFFQWQDGRFHFQLQETQAVGSASLNPLDFMLEKGIAPQWLVVKGQELTACPEFAAGQLNPDLQPLENKLDAQELTRLRGMLVELENPLLSGGVILLILRYASEMLRRAIIFDVRGRQLVGIGQFGLQSETESADQLVRKLRLTTVRDSIFGRVLQQQAALTGRFSGYADEQVLSALLGTVGSEVFVAPLVSDGKVVALLYGDNYPDAGPLDSACAFEVFLAKAGQAMEQMLQQNLY